MSLSHRSLKCRGKLVCTEDVEQQLMKRISLSLHRRGSHRRFPFASLCVTACFSSVSSHIHNRIWVTSLLHTALSIIFALSPFPFTLRFYSNLDISYYHKHNHFRSMSAFLSKLELFQATLFPLQRDWCSSEWAFGSRPLLPLKPFKNSVCHFQVLTEQKARISKQRPKQMQYSWSS